MKKFIASIQARFPDRPSEAYEKAFVHCYLVQNKIMYGESGLINDFLNKGQKEYIPISSYIRENWKLDNVDELAAVFEMLVNTNTKKSKGVVYTPAVIRDFIAEKTIKTPYEPTIIDPACGCGAFLISAARIMKKKYGLSYRDIFTKYIFGCDVDLQSIEKCKIMFSLLALQEENVEINDYPNLYAANSLELFSANQYKRKFDVVIGNPPYVRARNIDEQVKKTFANWSVVTGNADLYIPFYQLGVELLKNNGKLGYISPNTFLQSVNGRGLRNYMREKKASISIIDFKDTQNFPGVTHYTCIVFVENDEKSCVKYAVNNGSDIAECHYTHYDISSYAYNQEWRFRNDAIDKLIYKIEHQPQKLDDYGIRNGLATLCNDIFFFHSEREDDDYYYRTYCGKPYKIEKRICIDVAKPNIMRTEQDLICKGEKAIFPYENGRIISEDVISEACPCTYTFLLEYKDKLDSRDKGKTDHYPAWYAYGRTQGMNNTGLKVLVPYMADRGVAIISENEALLFYCGYAVFAKDSMTLLLLKYFIESDVFWFYIRMTSKPYAKGFMALAKNYIKNFGIPLLSEKQKTVLLSLSSAEREEYIANLYELNYSDIRNYIEKESYGKNVSNRAHQTAQ